MPGALEATLRAARDCGRNLLVPYVTGGMVDDWTESLRAMAAAGPDAVEVVIPCFDPVIDGPTIQETSSLALARGTTPASILTDLKSVNAGVPVVAMTNYNLVYRPGEARTVP
jgi:tryptophan synthase alpha chain